MRAFQDGPKELRTISGSEKNTSSRFYAVSFAKNVSSVAFTFILVLKMC